MSDRSVSTYSIRSIMPAMGVVAIYRDGPRLIVEPVDLLAVAKATHRVYDDEGRVQSRECDWIITGVVLCDAGYMVVDESSSFLGLCHSHEDPYKVIGWKRPEGESKE